jgi:hypothetical protein
MQKIFTYYQEIKHPDFSNQNKLLELWEKSWERKGFEPIVLREKDISKDEYYFSFIDNIKKLHEFIVGKEINEYGLSCFLRWLAYYQTNESNFFYTSDYDIINIDYEHNKYLDKLHLMDGSCPCFVSGNSKMIKDLCDAIIEITEKNKNRLKKVFEEYKWLTCYHDQEFFELNFLETIRPKFAPNYLNSKFKDNFKILKVIFTRNRPSICGPFNGEESFNNKITHFSHEAICNYKRKDSSLSAMNYDEARLHVIGKIIK